MSKYVGGRAGWQQGAKHPAPLDGLDDAYRNEIDRALSGRELTWTGETGHQRLFFASAASSAWRRQGHDDTTEPVTPRVEAPPGSAPSVVQASTGSGSVTVVPGSGCGSA